MELQMEWGWLIAIYLFLGGLGAGAFIVTSILQLTTGNLFKNTIKFGAWVSFIAIVVGLVCLVLDVDNPLRALILPQSFVNFTSWMAIGAWLLFVTAIVYVLYALFSTDSVLSWLGRIWSPLKNNGTMVCRVLGVIGLPLSLGVAVYTGILLGSAPAIPLWNTWLLPVLFTVSALDTGVATVSAYAILGEKANGVKLLRKILEGCIVILVAIEATVLVVFLSSMLNGSLSESLSAQIITSGVLSWPFWILIVGIGLCIPFIVGVIKLSGMIKRETIILPIVGVISALIGGLTLRYVILAAGSHAIMISPALQQLIDGVYYFVP